MVDPSHRVVQILKYSEIVTQEVLEKTIDDGTDTDDDGLTDAQ